MADAKKHLYPKDVAAALDVSPSTARKLLPTIPGAELLYRTETGRKRWRISLEAWGNWRASLVSCA